MVTKLDLTSDSFFEILLRQLVWITESTDNIRISLKRIIKTAKTSNDAIECLVILVIARPSSQYEVLTEAREKTRYPKF